ncbi:uncharacterized protein LOC118435777 [Folsomia candida]|uniref:uncharacterized protein LOC118435777 n=1 Tax=Folsomia candida TaxID=158441 RepID=UPI001604F74B|nr:uncharacterized protein LOC118435777 [Folsomia candida]
MVCPVVLFTPPLWTLPSRKRAQLKTGIQSACFLGEHAHTKLTSLVLGNVTKMCYLDFKTNQGQDNAGNRVVIMDDLTDHGVTIGDEVYTRITLRDKKNLIPAALKDLVNKPGKVLAIKDAFTDFVTDKENDPIFKYVNDYEDYDGNLHFSKTVCLKMRGTLAVLRRVGFASAHLILDCEPVGLYDLTDDIRFLATYDLDDPALISEVWKCIQIGVLDDPKAYEEHLARTAELKKYRDAREL